MKVAMIAPSAYPISSQTGGSVEICIYQIAKRVSNSHHVTIFSKGSQQLPSISIEGKLKIKRFTNRKTYLKRIIRDIKKDNYNVIQVDNRPLYTLDLRRHFPMKPILLSLHSLTFMNYLSKKMQKKVIQNTDIIVCNSEYIKNHYIRHFPKYKHKFCTIYLGVDVQQFRPADEEIKAAFRRKYGVPESHNILYTGRIIPKKGITILLHAVHRIKTKFPKSTLVLVGPCRKSYKDKLMKMAEKLGISIKFVGEMPPSKVHRSYWLGDVFVLPTQFNEAFGLVNIEAMASGIPVIAAKRGGISEILTKENGDLIKDYQNPSAYADAMEKRLEDLYRESGEMTNSIRQNALQTVKGKFQWGKSAENYESLMKVTMIKKYKGKTNKQ